MTSLYIKTPTKAEYDALMRLAEAAGYMWFSGDKPTVLNLYNEYVEAGGQVIEVYADSKELLQCKCTYYESEGAKIETIDDLSRIAAIYKTESVDWDEYIKTRPMSPNQPGFALPCFIERTDGEISFMNHSWAQALAVEYKPKRVKLPKFICDLLEGRKVRYPATALTITDQIADQSSEANKWLVDIENQWKIFDALRYGYEAEPEQLYYVPLIKNHEDGYLNRDSTGGHMYLDDNTNYSSTKTQFTMPEILAIDPRYKAFAVKVEEVDGHATN